MQFITMRFQQIKKYALYCLIIGLSLGTSAQDPNFHIYLCFGQSNMEGQGTIESQDRTVDTRFQVIGTTTCNSGGKSYTVGKWQTAVPPLFRCNTNLSPVDYFGRTMVSSLPANIKVGVVPVAVGGCDIALFDKVNYASYVATAPAYMKPVIEQYGGNPYGRLVEVAKLAQKDGVIKGILFHQGETNSGQATWPAKVKAVYNNLVKDLGLDATKTPFLVGEVVTSAQGGICGGHNSIIATVPSVIPNSYVISASGLAPVSDNLHFNSASYRTLGQRYAQKMLTLLSTVNGSAPTVTISSPSNQANFAIQANITITATASDADGTITKVAFYNGATLLGEDASAPYSYLWNTVAEGSYSITAVATDNLGNKTTSSAISITVGNPSIELLTNGEFDDGTAPWVLQNNSGASGTISVVNNASMSGSNSFKVCPTAAGTAEWHVQVQQTVQLEVGKQYTLSFLAKADAARPITAGVQQNVSPYAMYLSQSVALSTYSQPFTYSFTATATDATAAVKFFVGNATTCVYIDKVSFSQVQVVTGVQDPSTDLGVYTYPNPFRDELHINLDGRFDYHLLSTGGKIINSGQGEGSLTLGQNLPKGTYLLKISQSGLYKLLHIVKE